MNSILERMDLSAKGIWFPIVVGLISLGFMLFMPKRISWREIYFTYGTVGYVTFIIDMPIMARYFNLFDVGGPNVPGVGDVLTYDRIENGKLPFYLSFFPFCLNGYSSKLVT